MVISSRCSGMNLLNHIRQKKTIDPINIIYTQLVELDEDKQKHYCSIGYIKSNWLVELQSNDQRWTCIDKTKKKALYNVILESEKYILNSLKLNH